MHVGAVHIDTNDLLPFDVVRFERTRIRRNGGVLYADTKKTRSQCFNVRILVDGVRTRSIMKCILCI